MPKATVRHLSMIRGFQAADFVTLGNAACGTAGVFLAMVYVTSGELRDFLLAAAMAPLAFAFDWLDGRVARARQQHSALGRELDSLADVISFGVAPAALAFAIGLRGGWDVVVLIYFVCCGVSRLARYNVTAESLSAGAASARPSSARRSRNRRAMGLLQCGLCARWASTRPERSPSVVDPPSHRQTACRPTCRAKDSRVPVRLSIAPPSSRSVSRRCASSPQPIEGMNP